MYSLSSAKKFGIPFFSTIFAKNTEKSTSRNENDVCLIFKYTNNEKSTIFTNFVIRYDTTHS